MIGKLHPGGHGRFLKSRMYMDASLEVSIGDSRVTIGLNPKMTQDGLSLDDFGGIPSFCIESLNIWIRCSLTTISSPV